MILVSINKALLNSRGLVCIIGIIRFLLEVVFWRGKVILNWTTNNFQAGWERSTKSHFLLFFPNNRLKLKLPPAFGAKESKVSPIFPNLTATTPRTFHFVYPAPPIIQNSNLHPHRYWSLRRPRRRPRRSTSRTGKLCRCNRACRWRASSPGYRRAWRRRRGRRTFVTPRNECASVELRWESGHVFRAGVSGYYGIPSSEIWRWFVAFLVLVGGFNGRVLFGKEGEMWVL